MSKFLLDHFWVQGVEGCGPGTQRKVYMQRVDTWIKLGLQALGSLSLGAILIGPEPDCEDVVYIWEVRCL